MGPRYSVVTGFFMQDDGDSGDSEKLLPRLGLVREDAQRWTSLIQEINRMNSRSGKKKCKLIIAGRHGQAVHNLAESIYGRKRWDDELSKINGADGMVWGPDARLTDKGRDQAKAANAMWKDECDAGLPAPGYFYSSPLSRALETCEITFEKVSTLSPSNAIILENCREEYGLHTCDKRRTRTEIATDFGESFRFEEGFEEDDVLYNPDKREKRHHVTVRAIKVLDYIFARDEGIVISITAHSGFINGLIAAVDHKPIEMQTGGILPMIVARDDSNVTSFASGILSSIKELFGCVC